MNSIFQKYDVKKSCDKVAKWLSEYWDWKNEAKRKQLTISSPSLDGLPKGTLYDYDYQIIDYVNAQREWKMRENVLNYISSKGDVHEIYALILDYRFMHHTWKMDKVALELHLSKRTCERMQERALWEAAIICPKDSVRVLK